VPEPMAIHAHAQAQAKPGASAYKAVRERC